MINEIAGRKIISCRKAAEILDVTMGRVRQMARSKRIWSERITERSLILDELEVRQLAEMRQKARDAGMMPGRRPGGFKPEKRVS